MSSCRHEVCRAAAKFRIEGSKISAYCKQHAMDVGGERCEHDSCTRRPEYNVAGSSAAVYCKQHAEDGMIKVNRRRCSNDTCVTIPSYNMDGMKTAAYCKRHAKDGMVNVRGKRCSNDSCNTQASFNVIGMKTRLYCKKHAKDGMVNVRSRHSSGTPHTTEPAQDDPSNVVATPCNRGENASLDYSVINDPKRSRLEIYARTPLRRMDDEPVNKEIGPTVGMASNKKGPPISSSATPTRFVNDNTTGRAFKQTGLGLTSFVSPIAEPYASVQRIKTEVSVAFSF